MKNIHYVRSATSNSRTEVTLTLLGLYKKVAEPFFITQCVSNLLKAMIERDLQIIDGITRNSEILNCKESVIILHTVYSQIVSSLE